MVISQSVTSPVSGSAATCPRNPSRRLDFDLRVCRASVSTVEITRSGATFRAIRHRPSVPSEPSAGSTSCPATSASRPERVRRGVVPFRRARPGERVQDRQRVVDQVADQPLSLACGSSQSMSGLPAFP